MYLALYRKYRPSTFKGVIGQNHIVQTLINQIKNDKIGHAYLFCGSRGTGKTSTAKIFAKAINCLTPEDGSPCQKCAVCEALNGNNIDVLEIDAASNNGVDEIRELREKVKYPPVNGKYKVYIVDEVHMLSPSAFNALLKTLEEPPSYAVFILATTEVHKLPATILSRCLRFDFGLVSVEELSGLLVDIFEKEGITAEKEAIEMIARAGEGSVRDTLSIADRCVSYSGTNLTYKSVMEILGTTEKESLASIADTILNGNLGESLRDLDKILSNGKSPLVLSRDMISYFRDLLIITTLKEEAKKMVVASPQVYEKMVAQAKEQNYNKIVETITNLSAVEAELRYSITPRIVLETAVIKTLTNVSLAEKVEKLEKMLAGGVPASVQPSIKPVAPKQEEVVKLREEETPKTSGTTQAPASAQDGQLLGKLLTYLREHRDMSLLAGVRQVKKVDVANGVATFYLEDKFTMDLVTRDRYKPVFTDFFDNLGLKYTFKVLGETAQPRDVEALASAFGGKLEIKE